MLYQFGSQDSSNIASELYNRKYQFLTHSGQRVQMSRFVWQRRADGVREGVRREQAG